MIDPLSLVRRVGDEALHAVTIARSGLVAPELPHRSLGAAVAIVRSGAVGGILGAAAARHGGRVGVVDDRGALTWSELDRRANAVANHLLVRGVRGGDGVAILARNHRGFVDAVFGAAKVGARIILLNTDFAGPQIREVAEREGTRVLVCDEEYVALLGETRPELGTLRAWADTPGEDTLDHVVATGSAATPPRPSRQAKVVVLTSGTTGTPKGASRSEPRSLAPIAAMVGKVPFRPGGTTLLCAPAFHALGFAHLVLGAGLGSTLVLRRRFSPEGFLADLAQHRADAAIVVPVMMRRVLGVEGDRSDTGHLRILFVGGSQLGAELCVRLTERFGPVVYNLYGSTEVAYATIATPDELAIAPGSVGSPPRGTNVRILDADGAELPAGRTGRIFVNNGMAFDGYTGGGTKEVIRGLMSTGDVGHFDEHGLLHVDGRDDEMIVSGAENVFPREVEELLATHPEIVEAAVVGVDDEDFGQRLAAFVVRDDGSSLDADAVKAFVKEHLARFKVPRDVSFVDELPRNPTGKVLKRALIAP